MYQNTFKNGKLPLSDGNADSELGYLNISTTDILGQIIIFLCEALGRIVVCLPTSLVSFYRSHCPLPNSFALLIVFVFIKVTLKKLRLIQPLNCGNQKCVWISPSVSWEDRSSPLRATAPHRQS